MPIRIYALAKELKIDSKELVDVCTKAGISGKGSALASLDDDEVDKLKAYLRGPAKKPDEATGGGQRAADELRPISREDYIAPVATTPIKVISGRKPSATASSAPPAAAPPAPASTSSPSAATAETAPASEETRPEVAAKKTAATPPPPAKKAEPKKPKKRTPIINVAPIPKVEQPEPKPVAHEPKAQKPEIRLPKDAIVGHKKGSGRAPLEQLTKEKLKGLEQKHAEQQTAALAESPTTETRGKRKTKARPAGEEEDTSLAGMASARADRQKARKNRQRVREEVLGREDDSGPRSRRRRTLTRRGTNTAAPRKGKVALELPCTVRSFSEAAGVGVAEVQRAMMGLGVMATINARVEDDIVELLAAELGVELEFRQYETMEDALLKSIEEQPDDPATLRPRPPVVTFLGHVDHGKTSLLDAIIGINVVSGEAGGITQHIRAYQIKKGDRKISFVDTPGHEAFTEMRARGANVTDVAVLVVAADDGIMPQTEEAISHAKAAEVPIVVALNKMDLPGADPNRVMTQMTEHNLIPSEWGGDVEVIKTSATKGEGLDDLLDTILTIADLHEYQANPKRHAMGTCLEAEQEGGRGVIAKLMVKNGTLRVGDVLVCGSAYGRVKAMYDTLRPSVKVAKAGPSMPVNVTGLNTPPDAGDSFYVLEDIGRAREIAFERETRDREQSLSGHTVKISFEDFQRRLAEGQLSSSTDQVVTLNLIIRADVRGSIEAILKELGKLDHPEVQIKVLQAAVGGITVADVTLAHASHAIIVGFNVIPDDAARSLADDRHVEIRRYDVIYKVTDDVKAVLEGKLKPEERTVELGQAIVKQVFPISRVGTVAGCYVVRGTIERGCRIRVNRDGRTIGDYPMESLRREKDDTKEVARGLECGIKLAGFNDVKQDDILEAYKIEEVARTL